MIKRNRWNSITTKLKTYTLMGTIILGTAKLYPYLIEEASRQHCEEYGWMMNLPEETQIEIILRETESEGLKRIFDKSKSIRRWHAGIITKDLKYNCECDSLSQ